MNDEIPKTCGIELSRMSRQPSDLVPAECPDVSHETLAHDFWAEADQYRRGWIARFQLPRGGVKIVRDDTGMVRLFADRREAEIAAKRAFLAALDAGGRQPMKGKTIFVRRRHGRRQFSLIGA